MAVQAIDIIVTCRGSSHKHFRMASEWISGFVQPRVATWPLVVTQNRDINMAPSF